ncbi:MAG TPA: ankyrin repeat domain-containing protein [Acidobacteriaceae bacterium]|jgi:cytohesin
MRSSNVLGIAFLASVMLGSAWGQTADRDLIGAAQSGDLAKAQAAIAAGANINARASSNSTPLFEAAKNGSKDVAALLISKHADLYVEERFDGPPLQAAVRYDKRDLVVLLLSKGVSANARNQNGDTALFFAPNKAMAELLIEKGASVNVKDKREITPLHHANKDVAELLIAKGADVNARDDNGNTPLSMVSDVEVARLLVSHGADVNNKGTWMMPLHYAVAGNHPDIAELLVAHGADIHAKGTLGKTPLDEVDDLTGSKNQETMKAVLLAPPGTSHIDSQKLHANEALNDDLTSAARNNNKARVEALLVQGADVNGVGRGGDTALHNAASWGNMEIAELLLAKGADLKAGNQFGATPLSSAAGAGKKEMVELLLAKGADINAQDKTGTTPLWDAVSNNHKDVVELLIARGADLNVKNKYGQTLLQWSGSLNQYADANGQKAKQEIQALLIASSATTDSQADFQNLMTQFKGHSENDALRTAIINLALKQHRPAPADAEAAAGRGAYIFKSAQSTDDTLKAAKEYLTALELAPWVANYYYNLCLVLEKSPYVAEALHACKLYMVAAPKAADAAAMQQHIAGLQYAVDTNRTSLKQRTAYIHSRGIEDLYRYGGISGIVSGHDIAMKLFVDWSAAPPRYQLDIRCFINSEVYGFTYDLVSTDTTIRICIPLVSMHLIVKPEGAGFVELSDAAGGSLRATFDDLFNAKQKTMAEAVMFQSEGNQDQHFYIAYEQGGSDLKHAGFLMYESDCNGGILKKDPRALPDGFVSGEETKAGGYGRFTPEVLMNQPFSDMCSTQFAAKTGFRFGDKE